ncbi:MAG: hypothetical protein HY868_18235 [Chloroflexi bacterium]|nr:hypothetical protein [Chloroflexota bacterium]
MEKHGDKRYGFIGWREFHNTRLELLNELNRAKGYNVSRPIHTEHGNAGEAALRKWFSVFLPKKYGVTSGYIIPDVLARNDKLYHFDILIYDKLNSPILWDDGNYDNSGQGRKQAIPAKYVHAAFEVKASLNGKTAEDAISKLSQFNDLTGYLPVNFSCGVIFFDLDSTLINKQTILPNLIPCDPIIGYWGGVILHCSLDEEMTGIVQLLNRTEIMSEAKESDNPIAKNIDDLNIHRDANGNVSITEKGAGVMAIAGPDQMWHFSKQYMVSSHNDQNGLMLSWSHNGFARFALDLLSRLEGVSPAKNGQYIFGQVFDTIR